MKIIKNLSNPRLHEKEFMKDFKKLAQNLTPLVKGMREDKLVEELELGWRVLCG